MYLYLYNTDAIAGKRGVAASSIWTSFPIITQNRCKSPENDKRPHSLRFRRLLSLHSPLVPRVRPSLGKLKTGTGGCIKVHSSNMFDISCGCINLDSAPSIFNRQFLAYFYPLSRMGYLRSLFRDGGWHPMIWHDAISRSCFVVDHQPTSFEGFPGSLNCRWCIMTEGGSPKHARI